MAKTKKTSKDVFKKLKKLNTQQRMAEARNPDYGRMMLSLLTPTEYAELFPKYYQRGLPDISGFRAALTKRSQKDLEDRLNAIDNRVGSSSGSSYGSTPASGNLKQNQQEAYKAARAEGLSDKAAREIGRAHV